MAGVRRPDPEVQTGQALRRLRLARGWSQEEVAVRMQVYGYDFHQTMIAKIEAAQRPLRVRELADFATLFGVKVQDLVYPPTASLAETVQAIAEVTAKLEKVQEQAAEAQHQLEAATAEAHRAQVAHQALADQAAVLSARLASLQADRQKLTNWDSGSEQPELDTLEPVRTSAVPNAGGPSVLRVLLGAQLRRLREAKGISLVDAGYEIRASGSKINRMETGRVGLKERDVVDLLDLYGVTDEAEYQALLELAQRSNAPGWWHKYSDVLPNWFETFVGLEEAAAQIWVYETLLVPGLLQTKDYARAVTLLGRRDASAEDIERRVRLRVGRQAVLDRPEPPLNLWAVIDESVLHRPAGGPAIMQGQLRHLMELATRPNITIQIVPLHAGGQAAAGGPFNILRFAEPDLLDVVYVEHLTSALYLDQPDEVDSYLSVMERIRTEAATPAHSVEIITDLLAGH